MTEQPSVARGLAIHSEHELISCMQLEISDSAQGSRAGHLTVAMCGLQSDGLRVTASERQCLHSSAHAGFLWPSPGRFRLLLHAIESAYSDLSAGAASLCSRSACCKQDFHRFGAMRTAAQARSA